MRRKLICVHTVYGCIIYDTTRSYNIYMMHTQSSDAKLTLNMIKEKQTPEHEPETNFESTSHSSTRHERIIEEKKQTPTYHTHTTRLPHGHEHTNNTKKKDATKKIRTKRLTTNACRRHYFAQRRRIKSPHFFPFFLCRHRTKPRRRRRRRRRFR